MLPSHTRKQGIYPVAGERAEVARELLRINAPVSHQIGYFVKVALCDQWGL
jgi:hypothetical protein